VFGALLREQRLDKVQSAVDHKNLPMEDLLNPETLIQRSAGAEVREDANGTKLLISTATGQLVGYAGKQK
jgi:hypothetical protein